MPESAVIIQVCAECQQDLEHCHGTAILHVDGAADCADDPDCRLAAELHLFVLSCAELTAAATRPVMRRSWPTEQAAAS